MREFFRGWKRKLGIVTLWVACLFMGLWIRSQFVWDVVSLGCDDSGCQHFVESTKSGLIWARTEDPRNSSTKWRFDSWTDRTLEEQPKLAPESYLWRWQAAGFDFATWQVKKVSGAYGIIPHWAMTIPFVLMSAYLLMSKPRKSCKTGNAADSPCTERITRRES